jgi:hypothetical protein
MANILETLRQAFGGNDVRNRPWTPPDLVLDPILRMLQGRQATAGSAPAIGNPGAGRMLGGSDAAIGAPGQAQMLGGAGATIGAPPVARVPGGRILGGPNAAIGAPRTSPVAAALEPPAVRKKKQMTPKGQQPAKTNTASRSIDKASPARAKAPSAAAALEGSLGALDFGGGMQLVGTEPQTLDSNALAAVMSQLQASPQGQQLEPAAQKVNPLLRALTLGMAR